MKSKKSKTKTSPKQTVKENEEEPTVLLADDDSSSEDEAEDEKLVEEENESVSTEEGSFGDDDNENKVGDDYDEEEEDDDDEVDGKRLQSKSIEPAFKSDGRYHNKQRCLIICSRGVTSRFRHLLEDLRTLIPHHKKDSKLDASKNETGGIGAAVNEIAEMRGCNSVLFLECRKRQDAYLWIGHTGFGGNSGGNVGGGPSAKFLIENIHTMDELRLTGNCMKGSRPILSFDKSFDGKMELKILKCLLTDVFGTPRGHPKSKPFVDRVMGFYYADGKVCVFIFNPVLLFVVRSIAR